MKRLQKIFSKKRNVILFLVILLFITLSLSTAIILYLERVNSSKEETISLDTIKARQWKFIGKEVSNDNYILSLVNELGDKEVIENISLYGLSNNTRYIAYVAADKLKIYDLADKVLIESTIDFTNLVTSRGDLIYWDQDDSNIAIPIISDSKSQESSSKVLIINSSGELVNQISAKLFIDSNNPVIQFGLFENNHDYLLFRSYSEEDLIIKKSDGATYTFDELPVYINIYTKSGSLINSIKIRDYAIGDESIFFRWNKNLENFIDYSDVSFNAQLYSSIIIK